MTELAAVWGVSPDTIKRHIRGGRLRAYDMGTGRRTELRISKTDAESFLETRIYQRPTKPRRSKAQSQIPDYLS